MNVKCLIYSGAPPHLVKIDWFKFKILKHARIRAQLISISLRDVIFLSNCGLFSLQRYGSFIRQA